MDPRDGSILAMGSQPGFDATVFARPFTEKIWDSLTSKATGEPLLNRATDSAYPIGSTFKPITALAALETGLIKANDKIFDDGHYELGPQKYQNAKGASFGSINMSDALKVSSDVFFYQLGEQANAQEPRDPALGDASSASARTTGIDTDGEAAGPGARPQAGATRRSRSTRRACEKNKLEIQTLAALYKCGGVERTWTTGDNVNLAVGQGDLQATPLQVAVAYSALANNGTIVKPHLGQAIEDGNGVTIQELPNKPQAQGQDRPGGPRGRPRRPAPRRHRGAGYVR